MNAVISKNRQRGSIGTGLSEQYRLLQRGYSQMNVKTTAKRLKGPDFTAGLQSDESQRYRPRGRPVLVARLLETLRCDGKREATFVTGLEEAAGGRDSSPCS